MRVLFYMPTLNRFTDEDGCIIHDLHDLFDTWKLDQWKRRGKDSIMIDREGDTWSLEYLDDDDEDSMFDIIGFNESFGIQMDRVSYREVV